MNEINAITLHCSDMARSVEFYRLLGFAMSHGGPDSPFTSLGHGDNFVNLQLRPEEPPPDGWGGARPGWGRVIFHVDDPDLIHQRCLDGGIEPEMAPSDAPWGERYFHVLDPDGHELSFARPI